MTSFINLLIVTYQKVYKDKIYYTIMTLILKTESHDDIESGFYSIFTQFARLGEHTFATRHLCELVQHLAKHPQVSEAQILGYDLDKFWQRQKDYIQELMQMLAEAEESYLPELQRSDMERQLEGQQGGISVEDGVDLYNEGRMVLVRVSDDERSISVGDYRVSALHFGRMAAYLANGGLMGWMNSQKPEFSEPTIKAIKNSRRKLYREIRKEL